ncbi:hypothetical protein FRB94_007554 [Tulasnella sp. JGI-2019a]|nr:hypothetical protein FRB94_007554 [Tulasnella sp. JGI-2019a]KAG9016100.1 hypothetical protein FRB93_011574 [Tulasnella sp. JGI-2019a]
MSFTLITSGYANLITSLLFTLAGSGTSGSLTQTSQIAGGSSPSWIALSPTNSSVFYTNQEATVGQILSFTIAADGSLAQHNAASTGGAGPAHFAVLQAGNEIVAANYDSASLADIMLGTDPTVFQTSMRKMRKRASSQTSHKKNVVAYQGPITTFSGSGPNADSQTAPHPHQVYEYITGQELLVPDLGSDRTWRLTRSPTGSGWVISGAIVHPAGSGPRHCVVDNSSNVYTVHELSNTLTQHTLPPIASGQESQLVATLPVIPSGASNTTLAAGEVLLSKLNCLYPTQYIYVSNRLDTNPEGDSVAIFSLNPLTLVTQVRTGVQNIRGMALGGANGEYLVLGGQTSGGVVVYKRDNGGASLTELARYADLEQVTTMVLIPTDPTPAVCLN